MEEVSGTYSSEQVNQLLRCPICLDRYTNPRILPCQHTFCKEPCLEGLIDTRGRVVRCPECRMQHAVPRQGAAGFPTNLTIVNFLDLPHSAPPGTGAADPACAACDSRAVLSRCAHCDRQVCEQCAHAHAAQEVAEARRQVAQVRRGLPRLMTRVSQLEGRGEQLQQHADGVRAAVSEAAETLIQAVRERQRALQGAVDLQLVGAQRELRMRQETLEVELASVASYCDSTESLLQRAELPHSDVRAILTQCGVMQQQLRDADSPSPVQVPHLTFTGNTQPVKEALERFGAINVENAGRSESRRSVSPRDHVSSTRQRAEPAGQTLPRRQWWQSTDRDDRPAIGGATFSERSPRNPTTRQYMFPMETDAASVIAGVHRQIREDLATHARPHRANAAAIFGLDSLWADESRGISHDERPVGFVNPNVDAFGQPTPPPRPPPVAGRPVAFDVILRDSETSLGTNTLPSVQTTAARRRQGNTSNQNSNTAAMTTTGSNATESQRPASENTSAIEQGHADTERSPEPTPSTSAAPVDNLRRADTFIVTPRVHQQQTEEEDDDDDVIVAPTPSASARAIDYSAKGAAVKELGGERGSGEGRFTWPRGVAVSPLDGVIVVADSSNHRAQIFEPNGQFKAYYGSYGQQAGEFDCLAGVAINTMGQMIIADRYNHRIQVIDKDGRFSHQFGSEGSGDGQLKSPWGVATDASGFIYVCDKENHRIQVFQQNGTFVRKFGAHGRSVGQLNNPHYCAVSPQGGSVVISDTGNHRLQVFTTTGQPQRQLNTTDPALKHPKGVAMDTRGHVICCDSGHGRVVVFRSDGHVVCHWGRRGTGQGRVKALEDCALTTDGHVIVSDKDNHKLVFY